MLVFRYRPWLVLPERTVELDNTKLFAVDGSVYPSLYEDHEGRSKATIDLPPRARSTCASLAQAYGLAGAGESWLKRQTGSARGGLSLIRAQLRNSWQVLTR